MRKLLLLTLLVSACFKNFGQTKSFKNSPPIIADSLKQDENSIESSDEKSSYFTLGLAMGNRLLSVQNKVVNSKETTEQVLIYTPSISYQNKTGFNIAAGTSFLNDSAKGFGINQYYLTTGYQLLGNDNIDFSIAYTHYLIADKYSVRSSPIQNDLFTSLVYKKSWLQPGIAFDFSSGNSYEVKRKNNLYDSITNHLKSYALIASIAHEFSGESVFAKDDELSFTPSFLLNFGSGKINITHKTNAANIAQLVGKKGKLLKFENTKFAAESVGFDFDIRYTISKFTIEPDLYLDYYLPSTTTNRLSGVFNISLGYTF